MKNPFVDHGGIVYGNRFIGRKTSLRKIEERVLGSAYGNLAIMGLPRIGKSSLAWHAIMNRKNELISQKIIPIFFDVGSCKSNVEFFSKMFSQGYCEFEFLDIEERYRSFIERVKNDFSAGYDRELIRRFFRIVIKMGYRVIYVLDEFDHVQNLFDAADFSFLRELSYNPENKICIVTCSRKTIEDIAAVEDKAISNFAGIFSDIRLEMFSKEDVDEYWAHFKDNWDVDQEYKKSVQYYAGRHPFLMDQINCNLFTLNERNDIQANCDSIGLMNCFDNMVSTLEKENLLNVAIQLVVGPYDYVSPKDVEKLLRYGFLKQVEACEKEKVFWGMQIGPVVDGMAYVCFSDYCTLDLYRRYHANVPYHSLWNETENMMRSLVKVYLSTKYKVNWETEMKNFVANNPGPNNRRYDVTNWDKKLSDLKNNRDSIVKLFPVMSGGDLIDFTTTGQLFDLFIRRDNWFFNNIFKGTYTDWNNKFEKISSVRNVVQHNNSTSDISLDINLAREYCEEIKQVITKWNQKNNPTT